MSSEESATQTSIATTTGGAGSTPSEAAPSSALAESWEKKGNLSYYFAHKNTPSEKVVTTMGDVPRLLETIGGGGGGNSGAPPAPAPTPILKYQYADEEQHVTVYIPWEEALPQEAVVDSQPNATSVLLTLAPPSTGGKTFALSLRGLSGALSAVRARAGKTRVVLTLTKAEAGAWKSLQKSGPAADDDY